MESTKPLLGMRKHKENYKVIDLYEDKLHNDRNDLIKEYQDLITGQLTYISYHQCGGSD